MSGFGSPVIPAHRRLGQGYEFETSLCYIMKLCPLKNKEKKKRWLRWLEYVQVTASVQTDWILMCICLNND